MIGLIILSLYNMMKMIDWHFIGQPCLALLSVYFSDRSLVFSAEWELSSSFRLRLHFDSARPHSKSRSYAQSNICDCDYLIFKSYFDNPWIQQSNNAKCKRYFPSNKYPAIPFPRVFNRQHRWWYPTRRQIDW